MARCPYELIKKLKPAFDEIRQLEKIKEVKPGIFYIGSEGFMHFHIKEDKIWADIKDGKNWGKPITIKIPIDDKFIIKFVKEVEKRHLDCLKV